MLCEFTKVSRRRKGVYGKVPTILPTVVPAVFNWYLKRIISEAASLGKFDSSNPYDKLFH